MKFFMPDWEDLIDPHYSLVEDLYSPQHKENHHKNDLYSHEIYSEKLPYDGILVSLSNFKKKLRLQSNDHGSYKIRDSNNLREYFRIREGTLELMGDCGAYNYVSEKLPPEPFYSTENVADLYEKLGFDYGVSVDHMAVNSYRIKGDDGHRQTFKLSTREKVSRVNLTLHNAKQFIELVKERKYNFTPIGVVQGFNEKSYVESAKKTIQFGYDYVAIGGLVQYSSEQILQLLEALHPILSGKKVHIFGVLRPNYVREFEKLGVTSFDSASFLRKAWLRSGQNYLAPNGKWYAAVRVPFATDKRIVQRAKDLGLNENQVANLEKNAMKAIREYTSGKLSSSSALDRVMEYDRLLLRNSSDGENLRHKYERTLREKPWELCNCEICQQFGVEILVFRGTNRNKQRGFHNTWTFKNSLKSNDSPLTSILSA